MTGSFIYYATVIMMMAGIYMMLAGGGRIKKLVGMSVLQAAVLLFYISLAYVKDGVAPILSNDNFLYVNPLPHVLMLTAIVVGVATLSLGLALVVLINKEEEKDDS